MKEKYQALIKTAEKKEKRGFFERLTMKKTKKPEIEIQHIPSSNPYTSWSNLPYGVEREARISTISISSTSSKSISSLCLQECDLLSASKY